LVVTEFGRHETHASTSIERHRGTPLGRLTGFGNIPSATHRRIVDSDTSRSSATDFRDSKRVI
jgi:hypothetical protein